MRRVVALKKLLLVVAVAGALLQLRKWATNPEIQAGHVGYLYEKPLLVGRGGFRGVVSGPGRAGLGWRMFAVEVDVRPQSWEESFQLHSSEGAPVEFSVFIKVFPDASEKSIREIVER